MSNLSIKVTEFVKTQGKADTQYVGVVVESGVEWKSGTAVTSIESDLSLAATTVSEWGRTSVNSVVRVGAIMTRASEHPERETVKTAISNMVAVYGGAAFGYGVEAADKIVAMEGTIAEVFKVLQDARDDIANKKATVEAKAKALLNSVAAFIKKDDSDWNEVTVATMATVQATLAGVFEARNEFLFAQSEQSDEQADSKADETNTVLV